MSEENFWIDVTPDSSEMINRLLAALAHNQVAHNWTIAYLNQFFLQHGRVATYKELRGELFAMIQERKLWRGTQHYTLERTAEQAIPYFYSQQKFDKKQRFVPVTAKDVCELQIRARKVWRKYLAQGGGLTTTYGILYPEGAWKKTLRAQAGDIPLDLFPFLWHSITVRVNFEAASWQVRFNHHLPTTKQGRLAEKELKKEFS